MNSNILQQDSNLQNGKYKILSTLGLGGFGITYLAEQVSLGRKVAIKEFFMADYCNRDESTSHVSIPTENSRPLVESYKLKFIKEAQMIAALSNPHIVRIHDIFEENGTAYYVMEYLGNGSLMDLVKNSGALYEAVAIKYIKQVGDALTYIHKKNILHLDIKPSNILLNEDGEAVLIDFGISKHYDSAGGQTSTTPVGISKGYAPMEQYQQGSVTRFSPATDVYSLGATLYYLLTGQTPPEAAEIYEDGVPAISGNIGKLVVAAIMAAMEPKRKDRPQSIEEFLGLFEDTKNSSKSSKIHNKPSSSSSHLRRDEPIDESTIIQQLSKDNGNQKSPQSKGSGQSTKPPKKKSNATLWIILAILAIIGVASIVGRITDQHHTPQEDRITVNGSSNCSISFESDGGNQKYPLTKNFDIEWTYSEIPSWLHIHTGTTLIRVLCDRNTTSTSRTANIDLLKKGASTPLARLTVSQAAGKETAVVATSIEMQSEGYIDANGGDTFYLKYTIKPATAKNHKVSWSSSSPDVATISADGTITAKRIGKTTITAKVDDVTAKCVLTVSIKSSAAGANTSNSSSTSTTTTSKPTSQSKPSTINAKINKTMANAKVGETIQLTISGYSDTIEWSSDKKEVATVNSKGLVTAVGEGETIIWAKLNDGSYKMCSILINPSNITSNTTSGASSSTTSSSMTTASSSPKTISGIVTDSQGTTMPGVVILIKGTTTGVVTDMNGGYLITAKTGDVLVYCCRKFKTKEITVGNSSTIDVTLTK